MIKEGTFFNNVVIALVSQVVSLLASLIVSFIVPKFVNVENFGFWQLFLFYVTYINITRLGYIDGIYLKLGGKKYEELNHNYLGNQWLIFLIFQIIIALVLTVFICFLPLEYDRKFVFLSCVFCIVLINSNNFFSFILQAVNLTKYHSVGYILQNITWLIAVLIIIIFKIYSYKVIIICYIIGHILSGIYLMLKCTKIWKLKIKYYPNIIKDMFNSMKSGIYLMISFFAGTFVLGISRIIIDKAWGVEVFAYFSFSLTLANFLLNFINQISMVMFPAVKRYNEDKQIKAYDTLNDILSIILPIIFFGYLPISILVNAWLPQYTQSLMFLVFFLPICFYDGKMQLLFSTYFKVLRKEKVLMIVNIFTVIVSGLITLFGCYFLNDINFVACGMLIAILFRSVISEIYLSTQLKLKVVKKLLLELLLLLSYFYLMLNFNKYISFFSFFVVYLIYLFINKKQLKKVLKIINTAYINKIKPILKKICLSK